MMDEAQPIIVKKIKKHGHAHHGGAWKVAYADFVTAMMAFFLLMWLLTAATPDQKLAISGYFGNPAGVTGSGGQSTSVLNLGSALELQNVGLGRATTPHFKTDQMDGGKIDDEEVKRLAEDIERGRLEKLEEAIKERIDKSEAMQPYKDQLLIDSSEEGLRIQIIDKDNRPMFDLGSAVLKPYIIGILHELGKLINQVPNNITLSGHTDAKQYGSIRGYTNWELSADRANASRRELVTGGMDSEKIQRVEGLASTVPLVKDDAYDPTNRRISIIVVKRSAEEAIAKGGGELKAMIQKMATDAKHKKATATEEAIEGLEVVPETLPKVTKPPVQQAPVVPKQTQPVQIPKAVVPSVTAPVKQEVKKPEPKPVPAKPKPIPVEVKPIPVEPKSVPVEIKPIPVEPKPIPVQKKTTPKPVPKKSTVREKEVEPKPSGMEPTVIEEPDLPSGVKSIEINPIQMELKPITIDSSPKKSEVPVKVEVKKSSPVPVKPKSAPVQKKPAPEPVEKKAPPKLAPKKSTVREKKVESKPSQSKPATIQDPATPSGLETIEINPIQLELKPITIESSPDNSGQ